MVKMLMRNQHGVGNLGTAHPGIANLPFEVNYPVPQNRIGQQVGTIHPDIHGCVTHVCQPVIGHWP